MKVGLAPYLTSSTLLTVNGHESEDFQFGSATG